MSSSIQNIIRNRALIYHLEFPRENTVFYYIIEVDKPKHNSFKEQMKLDAPIDFNDYGTVLYSGYGQPPEEVKNALQEKYSLYGN